MVGESKDKSREKTKSKPKKVAESVKVPSGKFVVRVSPDLHSRLRERAREIGWSLNQVVVERLLEAKVRTAEPEFSWILNRWPNRVLGIIKFGSQVRGEATTGSDIDFLIVLDDQQPLSPQLYREWDQVRPVHLARWTPQFVHLPSEIKEAGSLWFEVALEGEILWEQDNSVREFIYRLKDAIATGKLVRRWSNGHPYWIRNFSEKE